MSDPVNHPAQTRAGALLRGAAEIVDGARNATHGDKERSFRAIAMVWDAHLASRPGGRDHPVSAADVSAMMVLLKLKRSEHGRHIEDHGTDAVGYAAIWGELRESEACPATQDAPQHACGGAPGRRQGFKAREYHATPQAPQAAQGRAVKL